MSTPVVRGKRRAIVETLSRRIREGTYEPGDRLEGELRFAEEFGVSRGTVRQALAELQDRRLIATEPGRGSFVIFDGHPLDQARGWAQSLAESGREVTPEVLSIEGVDPAQVPLLPGELSLGAAIAVRRLRSLTGDDGEARPISFECATVPATGALVDLPANGLAGDSLSTSLVRAGLVAARGTQRADVHPLDPREAELLHRAEGTAFLCTSRTSFTSTGRFVEHVVSLLAPAHFTLALTFGDDA